MRYVRKIFDVGLPITGMFLVFLAALGVDDLQMRILLILVGLMLIHVGVWKLANPLYPNERRYHDLRVEADRFINLVRDLNQTTIQAKVMDSPDSWERQRQVLQQMHRCVDQMADLAGREDHEPEVDLTRPFRAGSAF